MAAGELFDDPSESSKHKELRDSNCDIQGDKTKPIVCNGRYKNPWDTWPDDHMTVKNFVKFRWQRPRSRLPRVEVRKTIFVEVCKTILYTGIFHTVVILAIW